MNKLVRVSLHLEKQRFGSKLKTQCLELSYTESRALFAVQKLLSDTDYKGNTKPEQFSDDVNWKYKGELPGLEVGVSEYLDAYGAKKYRTKRNKMEYSGTERKTATSALERLAQKQLVFTYDRITWAEKRNNKTKDKIEAASQLIILKKDVKGVYIIYPSPILIDQIDTYFVWKPSDLYERFDGKDVLFIEYLITRAEQARRSRSTYTIKFEPETMAYVLGLDNYIDTRQQLRIRNKLNELYQIAKELGYLSDYVIDQNGMRVDKVDVLTLDKENFKKMRRAEAA